MKLLIKRIEFSDLKNVETFGGKNDVYGTLEWCGKQFKTFTRDEAGNKAIFEEPDMIITPDVVTNYNLKINVWDANSVRSDVLIGEAEILMSEIINQDKEYTSDTCDKMKKKTGSVKLTICLQPDPVITPPPQVSTETKAIDVSPPVTTVNSSAANKKESSVTPTPAPTIQSSTNEITPPLASALPVVAASSTTDTNSNIIYPKVQSVKQTDVHVPISLAASTVPSTTTHPDTNTLPVATNNATIPNTTNIQPTNVTPISTQPTTLPSTTKEDIPTTIPANAAATLPAKSNDNDKTTKLPIVTEGEKSIIVPTIASVNHVPVNPPVVGDTKPSSTVPEDITLYIKRIECNDLKNVESFGGKNDVFVIIEWGGKTYKTGVKEETGANAIFEEPNMIIKPDKIINYNLRVNVWDANSIKSNVHIGEAEVVMTDTLSTEKVYNADIFDGKKNKTGSIKLTLLLQPPELLTPSIINPSSSSLNHNNKTDTASELPNTNTSSNTKNDATIPVTSDNKSANANITSSTASISIPISNAALISTTSLGTAVGTAVGSTTLVKNPSEVSGGPAGAAQISDDLTLLFQKIQCSALKNVESFGGKNDVYMKLLWNGAVLQTKVLEETGTTATFDDPNMMLQALGSIKNSKLNFEVWDKNNMTSDVMIGEGEVLLDPLQPSDKPRHFEFDIFDKKKKKTGSVTTDILISAPPKESLSDILTGGFLKLQSVRVTDLINREIMGNQNAYCMVELPTNEWNRRTSTLNAKKNMILWDKLDYTIDIAEVLSERVRNASTFKLKVKIYDENTLRKDVLLGIVDVQLDRYLTEYCDTPFEVLCDIYDDRDPSKVTGHVTLQFNFLEHDASDISAIKLKDLIPKDTERGVITVIYAKVTNLKNTELIGKNDPYLVLKMNGSVDKTKPLPNTGAAVIWDKLEYIYDLNYNELISEDNNDIIVETWDDNTIRSDLLVGTAKVSCTRAWQHLFEETEIVTDILDKKNKIVGQLFLRVICSIFTATQKSFPIGLDKGVLHIHRIRATELKNVEILGKQDPFIVINYDNSFEYKTSAQQSSGNEAIFDYLDAKIPINVSDLGSKLIQFTAMDENMFLSNKSIGKGTCRLNNIIELNKEETMTIVLKNDTHDVTGKLIMYCRFEEITLETSRSSDDEIRVSLPTTFVNKLLDIYRINIFDVPNTTFSGSKEDCEVIVTFLNKDSDNTSTSTSTTNNNNFITDRLSTNGRDYIWNDLDFNYLIDRMFLDDYDGKLIITVNAYGTLGKSCIAMGVVSVRRYFINSNSNSASSNNSVDVTSDIKNDKSAVTAAVVELKPSIAVEKSDKNSDLPIKNNDPAVTVTNTNNNNATASTTATTTTSTTIAIATTTSIAATTTITTATTDATATTATTKAITTTTTTAAASTTTATTTTASSKLSPEVEEQLYELNVNLFVPNTYDKTTHSIDKSKNPGKNKAGRATLFLKVKPTEPVLILDPAFVRGRFCIKKIKTFNLKNTEVLGGKQDPYFEIQYKSKSYKSNVKEGSSVEWNHLDYIFEDILPDDILNQKLLLTMKDSNTLTKDSLIGTGEVVLLKYGAHLTQEVDLSMKLMDEKQKPAGRVVITGVLENFTSVVKIADKDVLVPVDFTTGTIYILNLHVVNLDTKTSKQLSDPYLKLAYRDWNTVTHPSESKDHQDFSYKYLDYKVDVDQSSVKTSLMKVELCTKSMLGSEVIVATGEVCFIQSILSIDKPIEVSCVLLDKETKTVGKLVTEIKLQKSAQIPLSISQNIPKHKILPDDVKSCVLTINRVEVLNLSNHELFGKQDPYLMFSLSGWSESTDTLQNAGNNAEWKDLSLISSELNEEVIRHEKLLVTINDENNLFQKDSFIGKGSCILGSKFSADKFTQETILKVDIADMTGAISGSMNIYCSLQKVPIESLMNSNNQNVMQTFKAPQGSMNVQKISCQLTNNKLKKTVENQQICIGFSLNDWNIKTDSISGNGTTTIATTSPSNVTATANNNNEPSLVWDQNMSVLNHVFTSNQLTSSPLNITLGIKKKVGLLGGKDFEPIGEGNIMFHKAINHIGSFVDETTVLKDSRGRTIGTITITYAVTPLDKSTDTPPPSELIPVASLSSLNVEVTPMNKDRSLAITSPSPDKISSYLRNAHNNNPAARGNAMAAARALKLLVQQQEEIRSVLQDLTS